MSEISHNSLYLLHSHHSVIMPLLPSLWFTPSPYRAPFSSYHTPYFLSSLRHMAASVKKGPWDEPGNFPHNMQQCLRDNAHSNTQNAALIRGRGGAGRTRRKRGTGGPGHACHGQKDRTIMWRQQTLMQQSDAKSLTSKGHKGAGYGQIHGDKKGNTTVIINRNEWKIYKSWKSVSLDHLQYISFIDLYPKRAIKLLKITVYKAFLPLLVI